MLRDNFRFNAIWRRCYAIIFGLTQCGTHDPRPLLSCVGSQQKVTSLLRDQSLVWAHYVGDIIMRLMLNGLPPLGPENRYASLNDGDTL